MTLTLCDSAFGAEVLRTIVRDVGLALQLQIPLVSLIVLVQRDGYARMASWGASAVSRLEIGLAEARAYRAWSIDEPQQDHRVVTMILPSSRRAARGVARFQLERPADSHARAKIGLAVLRIAATLESADAIEVAGDGPAVALTDRAGRIRRPNRAFRALANVSNAIELGTTRDDREAIAGLLAGATSETLAHVGSDARPVVARAGAPLAGVILLVIGDDARSPVSPGVTALPMVTLNRASLHLVDGNERGRTMVGSGDMVSSLRPDDRLPFVEATVDVGAEPHWMGPYELADGARVELLAAASSASLSLLIAAT